MDEKAQRLNGSGLSENVRNSVGLEHKVFIFVGQIDESGDTGKKGREKTVGCLLMRR